MSEYLLFWPKAAAISKASAGGSGGAAIIYTKALPTNGFTEVVAQLEIDADLPSSSNRVDCVPEISNDGVNWQAGSGFTTVTTVAAGQTFPAKEAIKITTIAAFMRFKISLWDTGGAVSVGATLMISGAGRS
jgi:hypothetical protein